MASDLDRVDHHRSSADWVAGLWRLEDARLLKLDAQGDVRRVDDPALPRADLPGPPAYSSIDIESPRAM